MNNDLSVKLISLSVRDYHSHKGHQYEISYRMLRRSYGVETYKNDLCWVKTFAEFYARLDSAGIEYTPGCAEEAYARYSEARDKRAEEARVRHEEEMARKYSDQITNGYIDGRKNPWED